jgi:hypothetical protein
MTQHNTMLQRSLLYTGQKKRSIIYPGGADGRVSVDGARFDFSADCRGQKEAAGNWMVAVSDFSRCNDQSCRKKVVAAPTLKLAIAKTTHGL